MKTFGIFVSGVLVGCIVASLLLLGLLSANYPPAMHSIPVADFLGQPAARLSGVPGFTPAECQNWAIRSGLSTEELSSAGMDSATSTEKQAADNVLQRVWSTKTLSQGLKTIIFGPAEDDVELARKEADELRNPVSNVRVIADLLAVCGTFAR